MPEDLVVRHCAPTLAGLKTANMFMASFDTEDELAEDVERLNHILEKKGLRVVILRTRCGRALIYVYRPGQLQSDLDQTEAREILLKFGYSEADHETCIERLAERISRCSEFPHEVGLFLGYPPEDVKGFIEFGGRECKTCGHWKVYGDVDSAVKRFDQFNKCTGVYLRCLEKGMPFERLAVKKKVTA